MPDRVRHDEAREGQAFMHGHAQARRSKRKQARSQLGSAVDQARVLFSRDLYLSLDRLIREIESLDWDEARSEKSGLKGEEQGAAKKAFAGRNLDLIMAGAELFDLLRAEMRLSTWQDSPTEDAIPRQRADLWNRLFRVRRAPAW